MPPSHAPQYSILLFLHWNARGTTDTCAGLYRSVGHRYVAEVVLADSLDSVCVCGAKSIARSSWGPSQETHTNSTDETKKDHSSEDVSNEVRLAGAVESSGRAILLVVVRRLGHAACRIS